MTTQNNNFLPSGYKTPESTSSFFKLEDGENRIRILSNPVVGYEAWIQNRPVRREETVCSFKDSEVDKDDKYSSGRPKISLFWGMLIFEYKTKSIKVWTCTQKTILKAIENLNSDSDWGSPLNYDISINKVKNGERTTYSVSPKPAKPLAPEIATAYEESDITVDIIFGKSTIDTSGKIERPTEESDASAITFE